MKNSYKPNDLLYWTQTKDLICEILTIVTVKTMLPIASPTHPSQDCTSVDAYNARVSMYNGGVRALADKILDFMNSLDEKDGGSDGNAS